MKEYSKRKVSKVLAFVMGFSVVAITTLVSVHAIGSGNEGSTASSTSLFKVEFDQKEIINDAIIKVDENTETYTISGTLRANGENPTLSVNGETVPLTTPSVGDTNLKDVSEFTKVDATSSLSDVTYLDVRDSATPLEVYGLYNYTDKSQDVFVRMDPTVAKSVTDENNYESAGSNVWGHNRETSGGRVRFSTDSKCIAIQAYLPNISNWGYTNYRGMENVSFDLYVDTESGSEYYGTFSPEAKIDVSSTNVSYESVIEFDTAEERNITIYFPILNPVSNVYVGVSDNAKIGKHAIPYASDDKIVWYGSSITQGGSVSSPGKTFAATVSRNFNMDFLNLGFWGSAKGQQEIATYIANMDDVGVFVLDYDHNESTATTLQTRHWEFYETVRDAHSDIPIIMTSRPNTDLETWADMRAVIQENYERAVEAGDNNVYFIDGQSFFGSTAGCLIDSVHPTDKGASLIAEGITECYRKNIGDQLYSFSKDVSLNEGKNLITIKGTDATGEKLSLTLAIYRAEGSATAGQVKYVEYSDLNYDEYWGIKAPEYDGIDSNGVGYLFGGWYSKNGNVYEPIQEKSQLSTATTVVAKFVPAQTLSVKCQNWAGTDETSEKVIMRVLSSVDSKNYNEWGFKLSKIVGGVETSLGTYNKKEVYTRFKYYEKATDTEPKATYFPSDIFGNAAKYYISCTIGTISAKHHGTIINITPYWITTDGVEVCGLSKYAHVEDGYKGYVNVPVNLNVLNASNKAAVAYMHIQSDQGLEFLGLEKGVEYGNTFGSDDTKVSVKDEIIRCVGNTPDMSDIDEMRLFVNLRFKQKDADAESGLPVVNKYTFTISNEQFCDSDEQLFAIEDEDVWNIIY